MARRKKKYNIPEDKTIVWKEKCVIYTRVSSSQQVRDWDGLRWQEKLCRERAHDKNVEVVKVFSDWGKSWKYSSIDERDWLNEMIDFLTKENKDYTKIHFVVVESVDRIIRDVQWRREIKGRIEWSWWSKIYPLKQKIEDTPEWKFLQNVTVANKQYQREANARDVKDKQRARMLNWYRPLYSPPWYIHIKSRWEGKVLIHTEFAPLIKDWITMFANWLLANQTQLMDFLSDKWFITRRWNKPSLEFIASLLERRRLLFYAGYIHYEKWNVSMVKAQHEPLFWLDIVEQVLDRLNPKTFYEKSSKSEIWKQLPLRWFLYDLDSGKKYWWWPSAGREKDYMYYSLRDVPQPNWKKSLSILSHIINDEFREYLNKFKIDKTTLVIFEEIMKNMLAKKSEIYKSIEVDLQKRKQEIDNKIDKVMKLILKTRSERMIENYENEIIDLEDEKAQIIIKLESKKWEKQINVDEIITNTKTLLTNPWFIRDLWDPLLQKMLIWVLFNNKIFYNKKSGFQTPEIPLVYSLLSSFDSNKSDYVEMTGLEPVSEREDTSRLPTIVM